MQEAESQKLNKLIHSLEGLTFNMAQVTSEDEALDRIDEEESVSKNESISEKLHRLVTSEKEIKKRLEEFDSKYTNFRDKPRMERKASPTWDLNGGLEKVVSMDEIPLVGNRDLLRQKSIEIFK